ncbi:MAG TPA: response regulator [Chitinophagaceae bacterium]|jgi:two-component system LytT family response regulator|nr:response regulator [Chitinophagaceae bacterium]
MKVIIVDDEPDGISTLKKMLAINCKQVEVIATCVDADEGIEKVKELNPDLIFLDIQMPGKNGMEMLAELSNRNFEVIFVTAHNEYMLQALQLSASDYLLKPVHENQLTEAIHRVEKKIQQKWNKQNIEALLYNLQKSGAPNEMKLCIPTTKGFMVLKLEDIILCEAEKNYTIIYLRDKKPVIVSRPLLEYEKILENTNFFRVHRTFLINLQHVTEYHKGEGGVAIMSNGSEVEISRRRKEQFLSRIKEVFRY